MALEKWLWRVTPFSWLFLVPIRHEWGSWRFPGWLRYLFESQRAGLPLRLSLHSWKQLLPSPHGNYGSGCHSRRVRLYQTFPNLACSVWRALGVIRRLFQEQMKVPGSNAICPCLHRSSFKDVPQLSDVWILAEDFRMSVTSTIFLIISLILMISRGKPGCRGIYCLFSLASLPQLGPFYG